jgi:hypothetical protein
MSVRKNPSLEESVSERLMNVLQRPLTESIVTPTLPVSTLPKVSNVAVSPDLSISLPKSPKALEETASSRRTSVLTGLPPVQRMPTVLIELMAMSANADLDLLMPLLMSLTILEESVIDQRLRNIMDR